MIVLRTAIAKALAISTVSFLPFGVNVGSGASFHSGSVRRAEGTSSVSPNYAKHSRLALITLQHWYSKTSGLYSSPANWWNAANSITLLVNYARVTRDKTYDPVLSRTFSAAQKLHANFINSYFDDQQWWALAWVDAYDLTRNPSYLLMAETIFANVADKGWDTTVCGGGVWWNTKKEYKNAITNELFLDLAASLAGRTSGTQSEAYLSWAKKEWLWFKASGMINSEDLVNDGLNSTDRHACKNNGHTTWTYNQGVIVGGLVELNKAERDPALILEAEAIANAAIIHLSADGVLTEPKPLSGGDSPQFKGIFMRNLMVLYEAIPSASGDAARFRGYAEANAQSIWQHDRAPGNVLGGMWQGPVDSGDATRQTSALDALIAAAAMQ